MSTNFNKFATKCCSVVFFLFIFFVAHFSFSCLFYDFYESSMRKTLSDYVTSAKDPTRNSY